MVDLWDVGILW